MRSQWMLISALIFALIIAIFSVINVEPVNVRYLFGQTEIPLIIVIIGSALIGGLIVGSVGIMKQMKLHKELKLLRKAMKQEADSEVVDKIERKVKEEQTKTEGAFIYKHQAMFTNKSSEEEQVDPVHAPEQHETKKIRTEAKEEEAKEEEAKEEEAKEEAKER